MTDFLVVNSTVVKVAVDSGSRDKLYIQDSVDAFDGSALLTRRGTKRTWHVSTTLLSRSDADSLETDIETVPVTCSGDLLGGSVDCIGTVNGWTPSAIAGDHRVKLDFTLREV
jgi:hypothetical protein